jgi:hypothetical protein
LLRVEQRHAGTVAHRVAAVDELFRNGRNLVASRRGLMGGFATSAVDLRAARFGDGETFERLALDFLRLACRYAPR